MLVGAKEVKKPKAKWEHLLEKMTHLHLDGQGLELVDNLGQCVNLSHVYLQDNLIYTLVNEPFKGLSKITQLSLYNNNIDRMEGFLDLVNLRRLYMEKNLLTKIDGLDNCR